VYVATVELSALVWYSGIAGLTWPAGEPFVPSTFGAVDGLLLVGICAAIAGANLVSIHAFKLGDVSYVAPLNKLAPAFVLPLEVALLAAVPTTLQALGLVLAVVAIYLANYEGGGLLAPFRRAAGYTPARLALVGSVLFAVSDVGIRALLSGTDLTPQAFALVSFGAVAATATPLAARRLTWARLRPAVPGIFALAAFFAVGVHLKTIAFEVAAASIVSPIVNTQAVVAVLLGGVILGEEGLPRRLGAAVVAVSGVALIAAG
jgi:drug/metabolite transporter (DMT)-like permease